MTDIQKEAGTETYYIIQNDKGAYFARGPGDFEERALYAYGCISKAFAEQVAIRYPGSVVRTLTLTVT